VWMGASSSWKTASSFINNKWIMGCAWLPNLSMYSLAVIWSWRVIMGPTDYLLWHCCPNHLRTSPMFHCWNQAFRTVGFLGCFPNKNSSWCREQCDHITLVFPVVWCPGFMVVTPTFTHLSITFSNQQV
jgi:hypothetical protein